MDTTTSRKKVRPTLETITVAEQLLSDVFGGTVRLSDGDDLGGSNRSKVHRFAMLAGPSDAFCVSGLGQRVRAASKSFA